ncbi:MAG TPA: hypothetical protein VIG30_12835 [Ktedonobacterales bacterium]
MSRSLPTRTDSRALAWSVWLYRRLLVAYPAPFRTAYGPQMVQVFRDCCRQVQRERGLPGVGRLWRRTLADLAVSALAERCKGEMAMSRWTLNRYCGFAAMLGGAIWLAYILFCAVALAVPAIAGGPLPYSPNPIASYVYDAAWLLFPLSLMGLLALAAGRVGALAWLGFTVALFGGLMLLVGSLGVTYIQSFATYRNGVQVVYLTGYDQIGSNLKLAINSISSLGYPVLGLGLALAGLTLWRARALPSWRLHLLPLALGVFAAIQYFFTDIGAPSLLRNTGMPGLLVMIIEWAIFALAWAIGWIVLGRMLWVAAEAPAAHGEPAPAASQTQPAAA